MSGLNNWQGIGHLGRDPELRYTPSGRPVCQFSIACSRKYKNANEELVEETHWQRCVLWGKAAETFNQYMAKGKQVYVAGRLQTSKWDDKEGITRYTTDVVVGQFIFLSSGGDGRPHAAQQPEYAGAGEPAGDARSNANGNAAAGEWNDNYIPSDPGDDDIPF